MSYELSAQKRENYGTGASRRLRNAGQVPAVIYGNNAQAESIILNHKDLVYIIQEDNFHTSVINLAIEGKKEAVIVRDFQMHPYKPQVMHIDFQRVDPGKPIRIRVPLRFINAEISPAIKLQGSRISLQLNSVEVEALPDKLPKMIEVDLSQVVGGQRIHMSDLVIPEGVTLLPGKNKNQALAVASGKAVTK